MLVQLQLQLEAKRSAHLEAQRLEQAKRNIMESIQDTEDLAEARFLLDSKPSRVYLSQVEYLKKQDFDSKKVEKIDKKNEITEGGKKMI